MRPLRRLLFALGLLLPFALSGPAAQATEWWGVGGGDGVHYLGHNQTTGGTTPSIGSPHTTSPSGDPNPAPDADITRRSSPRTPAPPVSRTAPSGAPE